MPLIDIKVIEAVTGVEGEGVRDLTHVAITETPSGSWALVESPSLPKRCGQPAA